DGDAGEAVGVGGAFVLEPARCAVDLLVKEEPDAGVGGRAAGVGVGNEDGDAVGTGLDGGGEIADVKDWAALDGGDGRGFGDDAIGARLKGIEKELVGAR